MQHRKRINKLGLKKSHRDSLLKNLVADLVLHETLETTESRAKALAARFGRMMSLVAKKEKREAIRLLPNYCAPAEQGAARAKIVNELKTKYAGRNSGYTRITKIGLRSGDRASLVQISLL